MEKPQDIFGARAKLETSSGPAVIYRLECLEKSGHGAVSRLPFSIKVLLEALLRNCDGTLVTEEDVSSLARVECQIARGARGTFQACARDPSGFYRSSRRGGLGRHARGDEAIGRRPRKDQSPGSC